MEFAMAHPIATVIIFISTPLWGPFALLLICLPFIILEEFLKGTANFILKLVGRK